MGSVSVLIRFGLSSNWVLASFWRIFNFKQPAFLFDGVFVFSGERFYDFKAKHVFSVESIHFRNENDIFDVEITFSLNKFTTSQSGARFLSEPIHFRNENNIFSVKITFSDAKP